MKWRVTVGCMPHCVSSLSAAISRQGMTHPVASCTPPTCRRAEAGGGQGHRHLLPRPLRPPPAAHDGPLRGATHSHQAGEYCAVCYLLTGVCCPGGGCSKLAGFTAIHCTAGPAAFAIQAAHGTACSLSLPSHRLSKQRRRRPSWRPAPWCPLEWWPGRHSSPSRWHRCSL